MSKRKADRIYLTPEMKVYYNDQIQRHGRIMAERRQKSGEPTNRPSGMPWWMKEAFRIDAFDSMHVIGLTAPDFNPLHDVKNRYFCGFMVAIAKGLVGFLKQPLTGVSDALSNDDRDISIISVDSSSARRNREAIISDYYNDVAELQQLDFVTKPEKYFGVEHIIMDFMIRKDADIVESMEWIRNAWARTTDVFVFAAESLQHNQQKP